jgi:elongation factor G
LSQKFSLIIGSVCFIQRLYVFLSKEVIFFDFVPWFFVIQESNTTIRPVFQMDRQTVYADFSIKLQARNQFPVVFNSSKLEVVMKKVETAKIRNVVLVGQRGVGKTTMGEALLYKAGVSTRFGSVDDETSMLDFGEIEQKKHLTVSTSVANFEWKKHKINLLDTPGASDFLYDTRLATEISDVVAVLVDPTSGVQVGTEKVWSFAVEADLPRLVFVTGMDKDRANWESTIADIKDTLDRKATPIMLPIGKEQGFNGVVSLLSGKAYKFDNEKMEEIDIPSELEDKVESAQEELMEMVAESDEELLEKYLETLELTSEDIKKAFPVAVRNNEIIPILCGSAKRLIGIEPFLDFIVESCPSPEYHEFKGKMNDEEVVVSAKDDFFSGIVFKTFNSDIGNIVIFRIVSGKIDDNNEFFNPASRQSERFNQIYFLNGEKRDNADYLAAGDIGAVAKLKYTGTRDSFATDSKPVIFDLPESPEPVSIIAVHPKSKSDEDKLSTKLSDIVGADPSLKTWRDPNFSELLLGGMGQIQLDTTIEKLKVAKVEVTTTFPKIPYRETITKKSPVTEGKHKKQSGGRGQFGVCYIQLEPLPMDTEEEFIFENNIFGGSIPRQWIPSVEKGIIDRMARGVIAGYPVINVKVDLSDGKYHDVDSSDAAFQMAGSKGFQQAVNKAKPVLLEPIYYMEVTVPQDYMGTIMGDITSKRGRPMGSKQKGKNVTIEALVPLSNIQRYSADLESMTSGRGSFTMKYDHYEKVPNELAEKIIAEANKEE